MRPVTVTIDATGYTQWIPVDYSMSTFNLGVQVMPSTGAEIIIKEAEQEAIEIKNTATSIIAENKGVLEKNKAKALELKAQAEVLNAKIAESDKLKKELEVTIQEHRKLTADRTVEQEEARKVKLEFTEKLKKIREIAAQ